MFGVPSEWHCVSQNSRVLDRADEGIATHCPMIKECSVPHTVQCAKESGGDVLRSGASVGGQE